MNELLELALNPTWVKGVFTLFLLRTIYRTALQNSMARIGKNLPLLSLVYGDRYHQEKKQAVEKLANDSNAFHLAMINMSWSRTRSLITFFMVLVGASFVDKASLLGASYADVDARIAANVFVAIVVIITFEQYTRAILIKRDLEAALLLRR